MRNYMGDIILQAVGLDGVKFLTCMSTGTAFAATIMPDEILKQWERIGLGGAGLLVAYMLYKLLKVTNMKLEKVNEARIKDLIRQNTELKTDLKEERKRIENCMYNRDQK